MNRVVLVVDDNTAVQEFISLALRDESYGVITASDGMQALEAVQKHHPNVILLDMQMPIMDGWQFLERYCDGNKERAPVIAFSANAVDLRSIPCVVAFVSKPFDLQKLIDLVDRYT